MLKASDIKEMFGILTTKTPIFRSTPGKKQEIVQGARSEKLKFRSRLCSPCNNKRSQPFDLAWQTFGHYLRNHKPNLTAGDQVRFDCIFPVNTQIELLKLHLYFVKSFGCAIVDASINIDTATFADALLNTQVHDNILLAFLVVKDQRFHRHAFVSQISTTEVNGLIFSATWFYITGTIAVQVTYAVNTRTESERVHLWNPKFRTQHFVLDAL